MEYEFTGRKPSRKQVAAKLAELLKAKPRHAIIYWGENAIEAQLIGNSYIGCGWIKELSGADIVREVDGRC